MTPARKNSIVIIPVRYDSSRLPGKPLAKIGQKPMIQWVVERTMRASLITRVIVATDDERIQSCVEDFGGDVVMTPRGIPSGTDRVAFVASNLDVDIVVNVQGDEPFIEPDEVDQTVRILLDDDHAGMGTLVKKITDVEELRNPHIVKVVVDEQMHALYFSRGVVPFTGDTNILTALCQENTFYKHVGIYSYRKDFLRRLSRWGPSKLEKIEKLEQLRVLEKGYRIKVAETAFEAIGVDTKEDLQRARRIAEEKYSPVEKGVDCAEE